MPDFKSQITKSIEDAQQRDIDRQKQIDKLYRSVNRKIEADVKSYYADFQSSYGGAELPIEVVRKRMDRMDLVDVQDRVREIVQNKDFSFGSRELMKDYNFKGRVTREELLKNRMILTAMELGSSEEELLRKAFDEEAYKQMEQAVGVFGMTVPEVETLKAMVNTAIDKPFKGGHWSDLIWNRQNELAKFLNNTITQNLIQGRNSTDLIKDLKKLTGRSSYEAKRLLVTETARVQTDVQSELMRVNDYEKYVYLAEPSACELCSEYDDKVFDVEDIEPGVNAPPMHPFCRCAVGPDATDLRAELEEELEELGGDPFEGQDIEYSEVDSKELTPESKRWWNEDLNPTEREAVFGYSSIAQPKTDLLPGFSYRLLNKSLYENDIGEINRFSKVIDNLDSALNKFKLNKDVRMYRGASTAEMKYLQSVIEKGETIKEYKSLTIRPDVADDYADDLEIIEFRLPEGTRGAYVGEYSKYKNEREFILARDHRMRIVELSEDKKYMVVEILKENR